jgi:hypothetical protein
MVLFLLVIRDEVVPNPVSSSASKVLQSSQEVRSVNKVLYYAFDSAFVV